MWPSVTMQGNADLGSHYVAWSYYVLNLGHGTLTGKNPLVNFSENIGECQSVRQLHMPKLRPLLPL